MFDLGSLSSSDVRMRLVFGVDSGVGNGVEDAQDDTDAERVNVLVVRLPSTDIDA